MGRDNVALQTKQLRLVHTPPGAGTLLFWGTIGDGCVCGGAEGEENINSKWEEGGGGGGGTSA